MTDKDLIIVMNIVMHRFGCNAGTRTRGELLTQKYMCPCSLTMAGLWNVPVAGPKQTFAAAVAAVYSMYNM